eukprot:jgi/Mesvir1/12178/Mv00421-RA.1
MDKHTISFPAGSAPLGAIAAARLSLRSVAASPVLNGEGQLATIKLPSGTVFQGAHTIMRYCARMSPSALYGTDAVSATEVDQWVEYASAALLDPASFQGACSFLDEFLSLRTYLVGHALSLADVAVWACLVDSKRFDLIRNGTKVPHLRRWFAHVDETPELRATAAEFGTLQRVVKPAAGAAAGNNAGAAAGGAEGKKKSAGCEKVEGSFDIDLPDVQEGAVITRFPPEPSGYLHIGHAKAALLNNYFARRYKGKLLLRFDDTNPSKEKSEFVEEILNDLATLGIKPDLSSHTSDFFDELMAMCDKMLREGKAYVDDTDVETMRQQRGEGIESARRSQSIEENLRMWEEMKKGSPEGLQCCVRGKMDMKNANKALRDPVWYRCNVETPHIRTGTKYKVYPTYDFACPFVDSIEGVTHALRSSEYHDRDAQYYWTIELMGIRKPYIWDFSRLNFVNTLLSKRKLQSFVDRGLVEGWNDPRFPTVQGIMRRGLKVEALQEFILSQGASKNNNMMEWDKIWSINKRILDPVVPRHTAVLNGGRVRVTLANGPEQPFRRVMPKHKKFEGAGVKATLFSNRIWLEQADAQQLADGMEVTLMDWGNAIVRTMERDASGAVTAVGADLHLEGSFKTTKLKLTWLAESDELVPLKLVTFDHLITKKKIEEGDDVEAFLNPVTKIEEDALGDANMRNLQANDCLQLERKGYYRVDRPYVRDGEPIILFNIPDGRGR